MDFNKALFGFIRVAFSIMIALLVLFAGIKICSICYDFGYRVFTEPAMTNGDGQDVLVQVEKGISAEEHLHTQHFNDGKGYDGNHVLRQER